VPSHTHSGASYLRRVVAAALAATLAALLLLRIIERAERHAHSWGEVTRQGEAQKLLDTPRKK